MSRVFTHKTCVRACVRAESCGVVRSRAESCVRACVLACLLACVLACLLACVRSNYVRACVLACLLECSVLACLRACLPACVRACVRACVHASVHAWPYICIWNHDFPSLVVRLCSHTQWIRLNVISVHITQYVITTWQDIWKTYMVFMWIPPSKDITYHNPDYLLECPKKDNIEESHTDNNRGWIKKILKKNANRELTL
jgi:hypothetical protein